MQLENEQLIKKWEALRLEAYLPTPDDVWTIGWGHTKGVKRGDEISTEQAQVFFNQDTADAVHAVNTKVKVGLTQHQFDALVSFVFNVGSGNFARSTMLRKLNAGDYEGAANEFPRWNKQKKKVLRGLVRRRAEEMEYFLQPDEEEPKNSLTEIPTSGILKPLMFSKELLGGLGTAVAGVAAFFGDLNPTAQNILAVGLVGLGLMFVANRLFARRRGQR